MPPRLESAPQDLIQDLVLPPRLLEVVFSLRRRRAGKVTGVGIETSSEFLEAMAQLCALSCHAGFQPRIRVHSPKPVCG